MATLTQIKNKANTKLTEFWQALSVKQDAYHAKHGKYFQLLITNDVVDGADTSFVVRKPNDEKHPVDVDFEFNSPIPFKIRVDEWTMLDYAGYTVSVFVELNDGTMYSRRREDGGADTGWEVYNPLAKIN